MADEKNKQNAATNDLHVKRAPAEAEAQVEAADTNRYLEMYLYLVICICVCSSACAAYKIHKCGFSKTLCYISSFNINIKSEEDKEEDCQKCKLRFVVFNVNYKEEI